MKTLRHVLCLLALLFVFTVPALATDVTLGSFQIRDWHYSGATLKLRLYSSDTWTDSLGYVRGNGIAGSQSGFYKEIICTISGTTATCPTSVIPSTLDSLDRPQVRITGSLFDANNAFKGNLFQNWQIPIITPTTWADLVLYNRTAPKPLADTYYTAAQVDAKLALATSGGGTAPLSTDAIPGKGKLSVPAASASNPVFVGDNDPRLLTQGESDALSGITAPVCAGVDDTTALTDAVATGKTIVIPRGVTCASSSLTISNTLSIEKGGLLKPITGQTVVLTGAQLAGAWPTFTNATAALGTISFAGNKVMALFRPEWWGATADDSTDNSAPLIAADASMQSGNGGLLQFSGGKYRVLSALLLANDGAGRPNQKARIWRGVSASGNGNADAPLGGTILDLRFTGTPAKIDTRGDGQLTIEYMTLMDGGSSSSTPFIQTTNTTIHILFNEFYGNTATSPTQDAIVIGGTSTTSDGGANAPYQGYHSLVFGNYFNRIQRALYGRTYANGIFFQHNTVWNGSGGSAAVEFLPDISNSDSGNEITSNLIELTNYTYGMRFRNQFIHNRVGPNDFFDEGGSVSAIYRFESGAVFNKVVAGEHSDAKTFVSDANASPFNDVDNFHQSQYSTHTQPVEFRSTVKTVGDNNGLITEDAAGNHWLQTISPSTFGHPFGISYVPSGGGAEAALRIYRGSATDKQLILDGGTLSTLSSSASDLRVQSAAGQQLCLGTTAVPCVLSVVAAGTSTALPITSSLATGTAPFVVASTTKVTSLNADKVDGQDWADPGAIGGGTPAAGAFTTLTGSTSVTSALFKSSVAKILLQGTGTGATQLAATQTTPPTCSSNCGTSPSVVGTDTFMTVTMGGTGSPASGWVITFNGTWAAAPTCVAQSGLSTMAVGKMPIAVQTSTTTITVTTNGSAPGNSDKYQIHCGGTQ